MVLSMNRWRSKVAVVTGAAGGIGLAVVEKLLKEGLKVVGVDNSSKRLEELCNKFKNGTHPFHAHIVDVTKENEVGKLYQQITESLGPVHILTNCAGVVSRDTLIDGDTKNWKRVLDINVLGLCIMTREAIKIMRNNKVDGHIIHIGSIAGRIVPNVAEINVYPASKFAVTALTESLRQELNRYNLRIKVTCICPGKVNTSLTVNSSTTFNVEELSRIPNLEPTDIADSILYALSTPPHVQVHEICVKPLGEIF